MASNLWIKPGMPVPLALPARDVDDTASVWTDLVNNEDGREACGYVEVADKPPHDTQSETVEWVGGFDGHWTVVPTVPDVISRLQLRLELFGRGMLDQIQGMVEAKGNPILIYWDHTSEFHINHALLTAFVVEGGWSQDFLEEIFTSAKARN